MRISRLAAALALGLVLAAPGAGAAGDRTLAVYDPRHRPAEELLPLARTALGERGEAMVDRGTGSLVLVAPEGALAEAVELLRRLDRAPRSVVLRYESRRLDQLEARGLRIDWSAGAGDLRVGSVIPPDDARGLRATGFAVGSEREGGLAGVVRVLEGRSGRIATGASAPLTRRSLLDVRTDWVTAASGFEARPRILGDGRVQVELRPGEASLDEGGGVRFTSAATTLTLRPGETVAIGSIERGDRRRLRGGRVTSAGQDERSSRVLLLTVQVEDPTPPPAAPR